MELTKKALDLIQGKNYGLFGTLSSDGYPHVTPVWIDTDGKNILVNTSVGRVKQKNVDRDPKVSITVQDGTNPYSYVYIKGTVIEQRMDPKEEHINKLAKKYMGVDKYPYSNPKDKRVVMVIRPDKIVEQ